MPLTDSKIRTLKPLEIEKRYLDMDGLYLVVMPTGSRLWRYRYTIHGKRRMVSLGSYPEISLADARRKRDDAKKALVDGNDPIEIKASEALKAKLSSENGFEAIAREWWDLQKGKWKPAHAEKVLKSLEDDVFPAIGKKRIDLIEPLEVLALVRSIEKRGALDTASRILQRCSAVFSYAILLGKVKHNPAAELTGALQQRTESNYRHLAASDLPEFMGAIDSYNGQYTTRLAMRLMMLTFVRTYELRHAEWEHIDVSAAEWRIPPRYMKMKRLHIVPLSRQAIEVIEKIRPYTGNGKFLFPNERNPLRPASDGMLLKVLIGIGFKDRTTVHGLRSTASTILNESGFHPDAIERQLAHVEKNKVRAAYNHADYLPERRQMMQWWADYLDAKEKGSNVLPFPVAGRR